VRPILLALSAAVLLAACGQDAATQSTVDQAATFNAADVRFLQDMIPHHEQAVRMATLVDGRTRRPELIKLAARLAATQGGETSTMRRWLARWGTSPVGGATDHAESDVPGMLGRGQLDWLKTLQCVSFDLGFVTMIRTHHVGGIEMAPADIRSGASTVVKALAARSITVQEAELRQMHVWRDAWSSDSRGPSRGASA
jgi:uncharacterized protein (DUF305 family)